MPLGGPGPRDWSPNEPTTPPSRTRWGTPPLYAPSPLLTATSTSSAGRRRTRPWAFASLSMLLGAGSVVLALVEPQHQGVPSGFIVSTIGVTAIATGVQAVRRARWGSAVSRTFGRVGAILGAGGSALMLYALLAYGLTTLGVQLPALSLPALSSISEPAPPDIAADAEEEVSTEPDTAAAAPVPAAEPTIDEVPALTVEGERNVLTQSAGTLSYVMRQHFPTGLYPTELVVMQQPSGLALTDGTGLAPLPEGTEVLYSVAADRTAWSVTLVGAQHGSVVTYSSAVGTVQVG
ncbi:hypothetical protein Cus16_0782 [Curtobacterium sp. ER1/6]|nr:hypothetical protein Cus16_0782 [Curtobacterium sp. ER1/6]